jgi:Tol biopolymer transport system component
MRYVTTFAAVALGLALASGVAGARATGQGPAGTIYSVRDDGTDLRLVAQPQIPARTFVRSPGGGSIAYVADVSGVSALFAADVTGANPVRLTPSTVEPQGAGETISPDGRSVAFVGIGGCGDLCHRSGVFVVDRDGTNLRFLEEGAHQPAWAPDSHRISYSGSNGVTVADLATGRTTVVGEPHGYAPRWAPRGDRIAYGVTLHGYAAACTVQADGSRQRCTHGYSFGSLVWSQDGRQIAFRQSNGRLGTMDADARHLRRFAVFTSPRHLGRARPVAWSPDGTRLAYSFSSSDYYFMDGIFVIRVATPKKRALRVVRASRLEYLTDVRWRGRRISYIVN